MAADSPDSSSFVLFMPRVDAVGLAPKSEGVAVEEVVDVAAPKENKPGVGLPVFEASDGAAEKLNRGLGASSSGFFGAESVGLAAAAPKENKDGAEEVEAAPLPII